MSVPMVPKPGQIFECGQWNECFRCNGTAEMEVVDCDGCNYGGQACNVCVTDPTIERLRYERQELLRAAKDALSVLSGDLGRPSIAEPEITELSRAIALAEESGE